MNDGIFSSGSRINEDFSGIPLHEVRIIWQDFRVNWTDYRKIGSIFI